MTIKEIKYIIGKIPKLILIVANTVLVVCIGIIDYLSGFEISFSIFYLLPVSMAAWFVRLRSAIFISILSAAVWLAADLTSGHQYSHPAIPLWNGMVRFGFFIMFSYSFVEIRKLLEREGMLARTDTLTGVSNSRYFFEQANVELNRAKRFNRPLTIAYIDVDNFKQVNDNFGHTAGDNLLQSIAEIIKKNIRSIDLIARLGGDEFVILLTEAGIAQAKIVISKIQESLLGRVKEGGWPVTFSIGVIICNKPPSEIDELIKTADSLMYSVKNSGKNRIKYVEA